MLSLLERAGATVTAQIQVTEDFSDPARADELRSAGREDAAHRREAPRGAGAPRHRGGLLSSVLIVPTGGKAANPQQSAAVLAALTSAGFITVTGAPPPGQAVVMITGPQVTGGSEADRAAAPAYLANQLAQSATGVIVAGRAGSEQPTGTVGVIRGDTALSGTVSTVDNLDTPTGRIATVLGLVEQNGGGSAVRARRERASASADAPAVG